jgi:hypothetical protein
VRKVGRLTGLTLRAGVMKVELGALARDTSQLSSAAATGMHEHLVSPTLSCKRIAAKVVFGCTKHMSQPIDMPTGLAAARCAAT